MLVDRLTEDMKNAMRARESLRLGVLRLALSEVKNARIEKGEDLTDADVIGVLKRAVKQREEAAEQYRLGNRPDLEKKEQEEAKILSAYLPEKLSTADLEKAVDAAIAETGATTIKDLGKVMKAVLAAHGGEVDGKEVQAMVRTRLGEGG